MDKGPRVPKCICHLAGKYPRVKRNLCLHHPDTSNQKDAFVHNGQNSSEKSYTFRQEYPISVKSFIYGLNVPVSTGC